MPQTTPSASPERLRSLPPGSAKRAALVSTYDLGHQPFGLGSAAAWLEDAGWTVALLDLAVQRLDERAIAEAEFVCFYLPMHTATRLAVPLIRRLRGLNPAAHFCAFGLYAPLNAELLKAAGVDSVIGGEFEAPLVETAEQLARAQRAEARGSALSLAKQRFKIPRRASLPGLESYAYLTMPDGSRKQVAYTEATRGCKHLCRHCPIVPVYEGRFFIVQRDIVLADIRQQVAAGATHVSFGDPDFFNGTGHSRAIVEALHREFPDLTYDVTIKIEHLLRHRDMLAILCDTGCLFVTSAVESVDDRILGFLDKGHTRDDFFRVVEAFRASGLALSPTFVAFTPWITLAGYRDLLQVIDELDLIENVAPVQLAIRLLIPAGSRLLELPDVRAMVGPFDKESLYYPWRHPDPGLDALHVEINEIVQHAASAGLGRSATFDLIRARANGEPVGVQPTCCGSRAASTQGAKLPQMSEPWYCCAEPTARQRDAY
jgi:radical SAM superfamily enzyme YgiQ (UPF0313 family)